MGSGRHLLALINDVLDLSKIEAGKMELYIEPVSVKQLLVDVESTVAPLIAKKRNRLTVTASVEPDEIETDKTKLRQNLFNLSRTLPNLPKTMKSAFRSTARLRAVVTGWSFLSATTGSA